MKPEKSTCYLCFDTNVKFYPLQESVRAPNDLYSAVPTDLQAVLQKILNLDAEFGTVKPNICQKCHDELHGIYTFTNRRIEAEKTLDQIKEVTVRLNKLITFPVGIDIKQETESERDVGKGSEDINRAFQDLCGDLFELNDENAASSNRRVGQNKVYHSEDEALSTGSENDIITIIEILEDDNKMEEDEIEVTVADIPDKMSTDGDDNKRYTEVDQELQKTSSKVEIFKCDHCIRHFQWKRSLKRHVKFSHANEKNKIFACNQCNAKFSHENGLEYHKETHVGKSLECLLCSITFKSYQDLLNHKIKRWCSKIELFECNKCEAKFTIYENFQNHQFSHTNEVYKCEYPLCTAKYNDWSRFTSHQLSHTKWVSCKCGYCNATFVSPDSLMEHVSRIHESNYTPTPTKQNQSICDICGLFLSAVYLEYHKSLRHSVSSTDQNSSSEQSK